MPEDLLMELETADTVAECVESLKREAMQYAVQVGLVVEGMKGSAARWENAWRFIIIRDVSKGLTTEIQATRPRLHKAFMKQLGQLKQFHALAKWLRELGTADVPDPDILVPEIQGMERLKASVFDCWQTAEELEDLAARDYPLTTEDLNRYGPLHPPPASWFAEESKPF